MVFSPNKIQDSRTRCGGQPPTKQPRCLCDPGNWLNPRRRRNAEALIGFIRWRGRKLFLNPETYRDIESELGLDEHATDLTVDDLFTLGTVGMTAGAVVVVTLLSDDLGGGR